MRCQEFIKLNIGTYDGDDDDDDYIDTTIEYGDPTSPDSVNVQETGLPAFYWPSDVGYTPGVGDSLKFPSWSPNQDTPATDWTGTVYQGADGLYVCMNPVAS